MRLEEGFRPVLVAEGKEAERVDFIQLNMGSDLHQDYQGEVAESTRVFCDGIWESLHHFAPKEPARVAIETRGHV